jgi:sugar (pentulose or hexulose) kinase
MTDVVLALDAGTSSVKAALVDRDGGIRGRAARDYSYSIPKPDHVELDFERLWRQTAAAVRELGAGARRAQAIGLSVLCPGLVPLDSEGAALRPAIIHLDRRSPAQAREALRRIGGKRFLASAGNLPFPGGISLTSALWVRDAEPELYRRTRYFGHTNTFLARRLTGRWGMDPSNAAFTGLYRTLTASGWDRELARELGLDPRRWPPVLPSARVVGTVLPAAARELGVASGTPVVMGAGDTACAALGAGATEEGDILNSTGTVEVMVLCTARPRAAERFLVRNHALPGRWLIMNILSTGGEAVDWVRRQFYRELGEREFFEVQLPRALASAPTPVRMQPYLSGDRTSLKQRRASYRGLTLGSTRDDLLQATCQAIVREMRLRFRYYEEGWKLSGRMFCTGGGAQALLELKVRSFPGLAWEQAPEATLRGAARLAWMGLETGVYTSH